VTAPSSPSRSPADAIVAFLRTRAWARRGLSVMSVALVLGAVTLLGYPLYTNYVQTQRQSDLRHQMASASLQQSYRNHTLREGDALTRIKIPKIGVDVVVVEGTSASALRAGAGHYPDTPLPCGPGNVAIAGHRTTYGKPFANIDQLKAGDLIQLDTPIGSCVYEVSGDYKVVLASDRSVVANTVGQAVLTLTSCHPKGSASHRIVVQAKLVRSSAPA
jgi:sortase A